MQVKKYIIIIVLVFTAFHAHASEKREIIGEALSKPIFRDQIDTKGYLYGQLHRLFRAPFEKVFFEKHKEELEPEKWELDSAKSYFLKKHEQKMQEKKQDILAKVKLYEHQLKKPNLSDSKRKELESDKEYALMELEPPDDSFYEYILSHWKFHKYLYNNYGGGRVIWEQEGMVAFDAMLNWLKHHEKIGDFKIYDEQLHRKFYSYWTEMDTNSSFFLGDKEMKDFIHPEWEPINDK